MQRIGRVFALACLVASTSSPRVAEAQSDPADWTVLIPNSRLGDVVRWNDRVVGADRNGGLLLFDPVTSTVESFDVSDGLGSNRVEALLVDGRGRLWVGTRAFHRR